MMKIKHIIGLATLGLMLTACQSKSFKISGTVNGLHDGDTLFLTTDLYRGTPRDTILVKDSQFSYTGETDSTYQCMIYSSKNHLLNCPFFLEPGDIQIKLTGNVRTTRVSGTLVNDQWQVLNDSSLVYGDRIQEIASRSFAADLSQQRQKVAMDQILLLQKKMNQVAVDLAKKNINNEFGYFLVTDYFAEGDLPEETLKALIDKMPNDFKQRPKVQSLLNRAKATVVTADWEERDLDRNPYQILAEVKKHPVTIIDFWASWCGPCRAEMPSMVDLYRQYKPKGLQIIGISLDSDPAAWKKAISDMKMTWPQVSDLRGWEDTGAIMFNVQSIPHTLIVNQQGKIIGKGYRGDQLRQFVEKVLKK